VIDSTGKALSVTLQLSTAETSFRVGLQSKAAGGESVVTTTSGSFDVDVGISKTAYLAGVSPVSPVVPPVVADINSVSLSLKGGYADVAGNAGTASATPLNLLVNQSNPVLA
jgi:hypothetical protein